MDFHAVVKRKRKNLLGLIFFFVTFVKVVHDNMMLDILKALSYQVVGNVIVIAKDQIKIQNPCQSKEVELGIELNLPYNELSGQVSIR